MIKTSYKKFYAAEDVKIILRKLVGRNNKDERVNEIEEHKVRSDLDNMTIRSMIFFLSFFFF